MGTSQEGQDKQKEILKKGLDSILSFPATSPYTWVVREEFAKISKILKEGKNFKVIYEYLTELKLLPENGDVDSLGRAYRREKKRRQTEGEVPKTDNDTKKTAIPPVTPPPTPVLKPTVQPTQPPPPPPIMGQQVVNRENETDEERRRRIRRELGTVINTGTSRIIKHSDGTFDVLDDDGNIQDYYVAPKKFS